MRGSFSFRPIARRVELFSSSEGLQDWIKEEADFSSTTSPSILKEILVWILNAAIVIIVGWTFWLALHD
jgi:hypothetical protein